jgi:hypothetical protein
MELGFIIIMLGIFLGFLGFTALRRKRKPKENNNNWPGF